MNFPRLTWLEFRCWSCRQCLILAEETLFSPKTTLFHFVQLEENITTALLYHRGNRVNITTSNFSKHPSEDEYLPGSLWLTLSYEKEEDIRLMCPIFYVSSLPAFCPFHGLSQVYPKILVFFLYFAPSVLCYLICFLCINSNEVHWKDPEGQRGSRVNSSKKVKPQA